MKPGIVLSHPLQLHTHGGYVVHFHTKEHNFCTIVSHLQVIPRQMAKEGKRYSQYAAKRMNGVNPPHKEEESEKSRDTFSPGRFERLWCHGIDED